MRIGKTFIRRGQRYKYVGRRLRFTRDGRRVRLVALTSCCADCGAPFEYTTSELAVALGHFNRRCSRHKAPGVPVGRKKGRRTPPRPLSPPPAAAPPPAAVPARPWPAFLD